MKNSSAYLFILLVSFSCSSSQHIEKRRYRKGFFVQWNSKIKEAPQNETKSFKSNKKSIDYYDNRQLDEIIYPKNSENSSNLTEAEITKRDDQKETKNNAEKVVLISKSDQLKNENKVKLTKGEIASNSVFKQFNDNWLYIFAAIITALTSWLFVFKRKKSKNISKWAARNPKKAIGAIVSLKVALAFGTLHFGSWLFGEGFTFSSSTLTTFFSLFLVSSALYPHKRKRKGLFKQGYVRQKLHDISIVSLGAMMIMSLGNLSSRDATFSPPVKTFITSTSFHNDVPVKGDNSIQEGDGDKIVLKLVLSVLAIVVFVSLLYLIAILTCLFACNGQEALAIGVLIFGLFGTIMLLVAAFKAIWSAWSSKEKGLNPEL